MAPSKKTALALVLLSIGTYIWLPTVDEAIIYPTAGWLFSKLINISLIQGVLLAALIYRGIGTMFLALSAILGGKPIYLKMKEKLGLKKKDLQTREK